MTAARFSLRSALSVASSEVNEDAFGACRFAAWVVDGVSGIGTRKIPSAKTPASWFATHLSDAIGLQIETTAGVLSDLLRRAVDTLQSETKRLDVENWPSYEWPGATVAIARLSALNTLEYFVVGDCAILHHDGTVLHAISDTRARNLEQQLLQQRRALIEVGVTDRASIREALLPDIAIVRAMMVAKGIGYLTPFSTDSVLAGAAAGTMYLDAAPVFLLTDGITRLFDVFDIHTPESFVEAARSASGLLGLFATLRDLERKDPAGIEFARFKSSDDATALELWTEAW